MDRNREVPRKDRKVADRLYGKGQWDVCYDCPVISDDDEPFIIHHWNLHAEYAFHRFMGGK